jgi:hypothetical protein
MLELGPDPDSCRWLPGARFNIAECALSGVQCVLPLHVPLMLAVCSRPKLK